MDLIDKEAILDCIRSGEKLRNNIKTSLNSYRQDEDIYFDIIGKWWKEVSSKLQSIETIAFDDAFLYIKGDPVVVIQSRIDYLYTLEEYSDSLRMPQVFSMIPSTAPINDFLQLVYAKSRIYDANNPQVELRLKKGFRSDLLALCFKNPARPLRKISIQKLEVINNNYNLKDLTKKDGYLENLYKQWSKKFSVDKHVIKELIKLENTSKGYFILISDNIAVEYRSI